MNKKLMAVAVAGAIGAPGLAFAQAANVNIYGTIDARFDSMKFSSNATNTISSLTKNHFQGQAPRWGIRGSESLGGGMTAYFQVESGLSIDGRQDLSSGTGGVNTFGGRDSYIGLRGSWGSIQGGGFGTAYKGIQNVWNANPAMNHGGVLMGNGDSTGAAPSPNCQNTTIGTFPNPQSQGLCAPQTEGNGTAFSRRESNYMEYTTPNFSGFQGKIGTIASEWSEPSTTTPAGLSQSKPKLWSYNVTWSGGPFSAGFGYETHDGYRATNGALSNRNAKDKGWTIGGKWNFGAGEIGAGYESLKYGNAATDVASNAFDQKVWVVNGNWKVTPAGTLSAGYSKTPGRSNCGASLTDALGTCGNAQGAKHLHLAYDHAMSKRTSLYAMYAKLTNNNNGVSGAAYYYIAGPTGNGTAGTGSGPNGIAAGVDVTTYAVGVRHTF